MIKKQTEPQSFFQDAQCVAKLVPAAELFRLLRRSIDLPSLWAAVVVRRSGDRFVVTSGKIDADDVEEVFFVRRGAIDARWIAEGLSSGDGFHFDATVSAKLALVSDVSELQSFQSTVIGGKPFATTDDVVRYLAPTVQQSIARMIGSQDADALTCPSGAEQLAMVVAASLQPPCFAAGLSMAAPPTARLVSSGYEKVRRSKEDSLLRQQEHEAQRPLREARAQSQREHVDHLSSVLARLRSLDAESPEADLGQLIRTFSQRERGELYDALFAGEKPESRTRWIVVAAGDQLLFFEPDNSREPARRLKIAGAAGPVRSVQTATDEHGNSVLMLGAASGVYRLPIDRAEPDRAYLAANAPSVRGGFNAVVVSAGRVVASHSELGIWEWDADGRNFGRSVLEAETRGATVVRGVAVLEGELFCAVDERIIRWSIDSGSERPSALYRGATGAITAIHPTRETIFAGTSSGDVLSWSNPSDSPETIHRGVGRAVETIVSTMTHGVRRLFFADTSISIHARVVGDSYSCRYEAGGQTLRRAEVALDLVVATNDLRDRLIVWSPSKPDRPQAVVSVASICGHSVQDVCLV